MCPKLWLNQAFILTKAHRSMNGVLYKNIGVWNPNVIKSKAWYCRNIIEMTSVPFESTLNKVCMVSYEIPESASNKVTVVGTGETAIASTFALLAKNITKEVCMIGVDDNKLNGEELDLKNGSMFLNNPKITATKAHSASADSKICVVTAGPEQGTKESEYDYTTRTTEVIRSVIPELMKYSPNAVYLVASDPVDVLSYQAWKAGGLPTSRVMGTGTNLSSARFRYMIAERLGLDASSCLGVVVGRNPCNPCGPCGGGRGGGVPVWSEAFACGVRLMDLNPEIGTKNDPEDWQNCYEELVKNELKIRKVKGGYTWALALSIADICQAILLNAHTVHTVSTYAKGAHSITEDIFISLPCVLGTNGIEEIVRQKLSPSEKTMLRRDVCGVVETHEVLKILQ